MVQAVSLFSGCGGCSLGLTQAGYSISLAAERDADACQTYRANCGDGALWQTDLQFVTPDDVLHRMRVGVGTVPLLVGGPPCQGFSSAGARDWSDARNRLLKKYVDLVVGIRPVWFVMENVEGLLTANDGFFFTEAVGQLLAAGYWVRAKKVYMERYGLPQRRKRVFVVGNLERCLFDFPAESHASDGSESLFAVGTPVLSVLDAIADLAATPASDPARLAAQPSHLFQRELRPVGEGPVTQHVVKRVNARTADRIRRLRPGMTMKDLPTELQHASFSRRAFRRVMDGTPTERRGGAPSGLKRLIGTDPCLTITSASPNEFVHPTEDRLLTLRECARIQGFPDVFTFAGSWSSVATQIGNAIPPPFMRILAGHIAGLADWKAKPHTAGRWLGIEATKSSGMSPALAKMLAVLQERTDAYV